MTIHIVARHIKLTRPIKEFAEEKIEKLQRYFDHIVWAQAILSVEKKSHKAEIVLHAFRQTFKASAEQADLYDAISSSTDKMERQIKKYKSKIKKQRTSNLIKTADGANTDDGAGISFSVVKQIPVSPMPPESAVLEMERAGYDFWIFKDENSNQINAVFKRQDGSYGIIKPVKGK